MLTLAIKEEKSQITNEFDPAFQLYKVSKQVVSEVIKSVANYGVDLKSFIYTKGLLEILLDIIVSDKTIYQGKPLYSKEKFDSSFALKNIIFECTEHQKLEILRVLTPEIWSQINQMYVEPII